LSALTFHGMNNICCHNLGFGKAYGYGKIKVSDINLNIINVNNDIKPFLSEFEILMSAFAEENLSSPIVDSPFAKLSSKSIENKWLNSIHLQELFAMAKGIPNGKESHFQYLKMSTDRNSNEFLQVKKNREYLNRFTQIAGINIDVLSANNYGNCADNVQIHQEKIQKPIIKPTSLVVGNVVESLCIKPKVVKIKEYDYDIQLVLSKTINANKLVNQTIKVKIKQISKAGKITQVEYVE